LAGAFADAQEKEEEDRGRENDATDRVEGNLANQQVRAEDIISSATTTSSTPLSSRYDTAPELPFVAGSAENTPVTDNLYYPPTGTTGTCTSSNTGALDSSNSNNSGTYRKRMKRPAYRPRDDVVQELDEEEQDFSVAAASLKDSKGSGGTSSSNNKKDTISSGSGSGVVNVIVPPSPVTEEDPRAVQFAASGTGTTPHPHYQQHSQRMIARTNRQPAHSRRILDRDGGFAQSRGRWSVGNASWLSESLPTISSDEQRYRPSSRLHRTVGDGTSDNGDDGTSSRSGESDDWVDVSGDGTFDDNDELNGPSCCLSRLCCCLMRRGTRERRPTRRRRSSAVSRLHASPLRRCWDNWYHSLAYTPTLYLMIILFLCYAATIVAFAIVYLGVSRLGGRDGGPNGSHSSFCGLDISTITEALYFSLSTMTTIGYGVSDYYFGDCWTPFILVLCQVFCAITYDAVAIGLLFTRMSRGQKRGRTIIFSDVACVRRVRGKHFLCFRVGELTRNRSIIAAKVIVHCVRHERHPVSDSYGGHMGPVPIATTHYQTHHVHLLSPDEAVGAPLLLSLPHVIVHALDGGYGNSRSSPLIPSSPFWYDYDGQANAWPPQAVAEQHHMETAVDTTDHKTSAARVGAAGAAGAAAGLLLAGPLIAAGAGVAAGAGAAYAAASKMGGRKSNDDGGSLGVTKEGDDDAASRETNSATQSENVTEEKPDSTPVRSASDIWNDEIKRFMSDREAELIVLVEGTDEMTGAAVQARHSYRWDDIVFDATFAPCIFPRAACGGNDDEDDDSENEIAPADPLTTPLLTDEERGVIRTRERQQSRRTQGPASSSTACVIDFSKFHDVVPAPADSQGCPYVPDWA